MKKIVRLTRNGHATHVNIPRQLLDFMRWRAGDYIVVELTERNTLEVRQASGVDLRAESPRPAPAPLPLEEQA